MSTRGDGRVFARGQSWRIQYSVRGRQHREPARVNDRKLGVRRPAKNEAEALSALRARRREIEGGRFVGPRVEKVLVSELITALLHDSPQ